MELYRIFYFVAKSGSISKAAKKLFTSQPAVSQSIRQLEEKLGGTLFYRNPRGVSLTTEGELLFSYVEQGYLMMETAERKYKEMKDLLSGQLRISVCNEITKNYLLDIIYEYNKLYPYIKIQIKDEASSDILRKLENGNIDVGIMNLHGQELDNITILSSFQLQDCFLVGEKYKEQFQTPISLKDLVERYPLILLQANGNTRTYIDNFFHEHGIQVNPQFELSNMDVVMKFAQKGLGVGCVVKEYAQSELERGLLYEVLVDERIKPRNLGVAVKKDLPLSTATREFIRMVDIHSKE